MYGRQITVVNVASQCGSIPNQTTLSWMNFLGHITIEVKGAQMQPVGAQMQPKIGSFKSLFDQPIFITNGSVYYSLLSLTEHRSTPRDRPKGALLTVVLRYRVDFPLWSTKWDRLAGAPLSQCSTNESQLYQEIQSCSWCLLAA